MGGLHSAWHPESAVSLSFQEGGVRLVRCGGCGVFVPLGRCGDGTGPGGPGLPANCSRVSPAGVSAAMQLTPRAGLGLSRLRQARLIPLMKTARLWTLHLSFPIKTPGKCMALSFSPHTQLDRFSDLIHSHCLLPRELRTEVAAAFRKKRVGRSQDGGLLGAAGWGCSLNFSSG